MTATVEIDARAEAAMRYILSLRPQEFVATRRGHEGVLALQEHLRGGPSDAVKAALRIWAEEHEHVWEEVDGECRMACGIRVITPSYFFWAVRKLNPIEISDVTLQKMFVSFPIESIIELKNGRLHGKWIMTGPTTNILKEWNGKEAIVWLNMDPNWWMQVGESFVE